MSLLLKDRVKEYTTTTGTGTLTLVSAPSGFRRFSAALSNGDTTYYCIESGAQWEVGLGTYSTNTFSRDTVLASSNSGSKINITASRSTVFVTYPATKAVYKNTAGEIIVDSAIRFSDNSSQSTAFLGEVDYSGISGVPANSLLGNNTGSVGDAVALNASASRTLLGLSTSDSPTFAGLTLTGSVSAAAYSSSFRYTELYPDGSTGFPIIIYKSRGTYASPTQVLTGDNMGGFTCIGRNASGWNTGPSARIYVSALEDFNVNTSRGAALIFDTVSLGGLSTSTRLKITTDLTAYGNLLFDTTNSYDIGNGTYDPRTVRAATSVLTPAVSNTSAALTLTGGPDAGYYSTEGVMLKTVSSATAYLRAGAGILYFHQTGLTPSYIHQAVSGDFTIYSQNTNADINLSTFGASGYVNITNNTHNGVLRVGTVESGASLPITIGNSTYGVTVPGRIAANGGITSPGVSVYSERFGLNASAAANGTAVGSGATAAGTNGSAFGYGASAGENATAGGVVAAVSSYGTGFGMGATAGSQSAAFGYYATTGAYSTAVGYAANATPTGSIALGDQATTTAVAQLQIGSAAFPITQQRFHTNGGSLTFANETGTFLTVANAGAATFSGRVVSHSGGGPSLQLHSSVYSAAGFNQYINDAGSWTTGITGYSGAWQFLTSTGELQWWRSTASTTAGGNPSTSSVFSIAQNGAATFSGNITTGPKITVNQTGVNGTALQVNNDYGGFRFDSGGGSAVQILSASGGYANLIVRTAQITDFVETARVIFPTGGRITPITDGVRVQNAAQSADGAFQAGDATFSGTVTATSPAQNTSGFIARGSSLDQNWGGGIDFTANNGTVYGSIRSSIVAPGLIQTGTAFTGTCTFANAGYPNPTIKVIQSSNTGVTYNATAGQFLTFQWFGDYADRGGIGVDNSGYFAVRSAGAGYHGLYLTNTSFGLYGGSVGYAIRAFTNTGFNVRNYADTADAPITAGAATFSGDISMSKTSAQGYIYAYNPSGTQYGRFYTSNANETFVEAQSYLILRGGTTGIVEVSKSGVTAKVNIYDSSVTKIFSSYHDGTNGIVSTSAGNLNLVPTGGTVAVTGAATFSGNVGIGRTPTAQLDVYNASASLTAKFGSGNNFASVEINSATGIPAYLVSPTNLQLYVGGSARQTINATDGSTTFAGDVIVPTWPKMIKTSSGEMVLSPASGLMYQYTTNIDSQFRLYNAAGSKMLRMDCYTFGDYCSIQAGGTNMKLTVQEAEGRPFVVGNTGTAAAKFHVRADATAGSGLPVRIDGVTGNGSNLTEWGLYGSTTLAAITSAGGATFSSNVLLPVNGYVSSTENAAQHRITIKSGSGGVVVSGDNTDGVRFVQNNISQVTSIQGTAGLALYCTSSAMTFSVAAASDATREFRFTSGNGGAAMRAEFDVETTAGSLAVLQATTEVFKVLGTGAVSCAGITASALIKGSETTSTPSGTTQTITLESGNCQTLDLTSSTGDVTVTLTVPASSAFGSLLIKQHATTSRDITWAASSGSIVWLGTEPTWNGDATSSYREVSWRFNGTNTYLTASESS